MAEQNCRLEEELRRHRIDASIFTPFVVLRLGDAGANQNAQISVRLRDMDSPGEVVHSLNLSWEDQSVPVLPLGVQERVVTEWAACGIACAVLSVYTDLRIRSVAAEGDRFDYWIGNDEYEYGLEVSGTVMEAQEDVEARHRSKVRQLLDNPYEVDGYVIVVSFAARQAICSFHRFEEN